MKYGLNFQSWPIWTFKGVLESLLWDELWLENIQSMIIHLDKLGPKVCISEHFKRSPEYQEQRTEITEIWRDQPVAFRI